MEDKYWTERVKFVDAIRDLLIELGTATAEAEKAKEDLAWEKRKREEAEKALASIQEQDLSTCGKILEIMEKLSD